MRRKHVLSFIAMGLCAAMLGLTGCDGDGDGDGGDTAGGGLPGTWTLNGATITAPLVGDNAALLQLAGAPVSGDTVTLSGPFLTLFGVSATLIADDDGTWTIQITIPGIPGYTTAGTYTAEGTYTTSGDRMTITVTSVPGGAADLVEVGDVFTVSYTQTANSLELSASSADLGRPGVAVAIAFTR